MRSTMLSFVMFFLTESKKERLAPTEERFRFFTGP